MRLYDDTYMVARMQGGNAYFIGKGLSYDEAKTISKRVGPCTKQRSHIFILKVVDDIILQGKRED